MRSTYGTTTEYENAVEVFFNIPEVSVIQKKIEVLEAEWHQKDLIKIGNARKFEIPSFGYVYALSNPFFSGMLKIGFTFNTPKIRARQLSSTGVPEPFTVVAEIKCRDPFGIEREVHRHFDANRPYVIGI